MLRSGEWFYAWRAQPICDDDCDDSINHSDGLLLGPCDALVFLSKETFLQELIGYSLTSENVNNHFAGVSLLGAACCLGLPDAVRLLLEVPGIDVNDENATITPLHAAVWGLCNEENAEGDYEVIIGMLMEKGANPTIKDKVEGIELTANEYLKSFGKALLQSKPEEEVPNNKIPSIYLIIRDYDSNCK